MKTIRSPHELSYRLLSNSFAEMLHKLDNNIAQRLVALNQLGFYKDSIRNITLRRNKIMSYCPSGKDTVLNEDGTKWAKTNRQEGKYGKLIRKVLNEQIPNFKYDDKDLEDLVNLLKAEVSDGMFRVVKGSDIALWYNKPKQDGHGTLSSSCMQGKPKDYFHLYTENSDIISLLALIKDNNELIGRALLWSIGGETYMDRIYGGDDTIQRFKNYAKQRGFNHKLKQSYDHKTDWVSPDGSSFTKYITIQGLDTDFSLYPYVDTFSYIDSCANLTNDIDDADQELTSTGGDINYVDDEDYVYCEETDNRIHVDDAVYIEDYGYVGEGYAVYDDLNDCYILAAESVAMHNGEVTHEDNPDIICDYWGDYRMLEDTFECAYDGNIYSIDEMHYIEELDVEVHQDNVDDMLEQEGYVETEDGDWVKLKQK
jgi:hypothetical protein